jgi:hypothetical protein
MDEDDDDEDTDALDFSEQLVADHVNELAELIDRSASSEVCGHAVGTFVCLCMNTHTYKHEYGFGLVFPCGSVVCRRHTQNCIYGVAGLMMQFSPRLPMYC